MEKKFTACKFLDFETAFIFCKKQINDDGKVYWLRDVSYGTSLPDKVQFCKKRGRLNSQEACLDVFSKHCSLYEEGKHDVSIDYE